MSEYGSYTKYSKEPWRVDEPHQIYSEAEGEYVAVTEWGDNVLPIGVWIANARRIVACVNALQGAKTEDLEEAATLGISDVSMGNLFSSRLALQKQRDEGTKILRMFETWWRLPNTERTIENIEPAMRAAIEVLYAEAKK